MQDKFYADKRDLVKWAVLHRLAETYQAQRILQLAFYRPSEFAKIIIDGVEYDIPKEVRSHFRDIRTVEKIKSKIQVTVFYELFYNRNSYLEAVKKFLSKFQEERCVVFLDPDTGLEPREPNLTHVLESEAKAIWESIKVGDVYVFYQHQTNMAGQPWIEPKRRQLEEALRLPEQSIKIAQGPQIAHDVAFFYKQKP
ncbi:MAG: hypothetical protein L6277_04875 [Desulfobacterales bacterium]|nr:hypothetical protein [Pseudomonadota bacterium]MBU4357310.1 hypothetical protein [Pseudomonadota bacterium]MCG2771407.1 hypothetical protein [Desulfobacterales bacterium]